MRYPASEKLEIIRLVEQSQPDGGDWWWALSDHIPVLVAFEA